MRTFAFFLSFSFIFSPVNDRKRVNGDMDHKTSPSESEILAKKSKLVGFFFFFP